MNQEALQQYQMSLTEYQRIVNQLPDKKYYEFVYNKFFNPDVQYKNWQPWDQWNYPVQDAVRFKTILLDNVSHINNCSVVDFGCHLGYMSMFASHLGASRVTGTNIRPNELALAQELCEISQHHNVSFALSDVQNPKLVQDLCNQHQTVLFSGILYHMNNHCEILQAITSSTASTVIIDTMVDAAIKDSTEPLMSFRVDNCADSVSGFDTAGAKTMLVGRPNQAWVDLAMQHMGWNRAYAREYMMIHPSQRHRHVSTWIR